MENLIEIKEEIYKKDIYIQEPLLCLPTCISAIFDSFYNYEINPFSVLKAGIFTKCLNFHVKNMEERKYFLDKYNMDFAITNKKIYGTSITDSLNPLFRFISILVGVEKVYSKYNINTPLKEFFCNSSCYSINNDNDGSIYSIKKFLTDYSVKKCYMLAFLNYSKLMKEDFNKYSDHVVIVNKINEDDNSFELLCPIENENIKVIKVTEEQFKNSFIRDDPSHGYSFIVSN